MTVHHYCRESARTLALPSDPPRARGPLGGVDEGLHRQQNRPDRVHYHASDLHAHRARYTPCPAVCGGRSGYRTTSRPTTTLSSSARWHGLSPGHSGLRSCCVCFADCDRLRCSDGGALIAAPTKSQCRSFQCRLHRWTGRGSISCSSCCPLTTCRCQTDGPVLGQSNVAFRGGPVSRARAPPWPRTPCLARQEVGIRANSRTPPDRTPVTVSEPAQNDVRRNGRHPTASGPTHCENRVPGPTSRAAQAP